jgi:hypothetical protein
MTSAISKNPGKGASDGVISELATFFDVLPGHEEELRAAVQRFTEAVRNLDLKDGIRSGLRDTRHVIFDNGLRLLWCTTFEGAWDTHVDDVLLVVGVEQFTGWLRHTVQGQDFAARAALAAVVEKFGGNDPDGEDAMAKSGAQLKATLQSVRSQAAAYFNPLGVLPLPRIIKAQRLERAFRHLLSKPTAEEVLRHPDLKPLIQKAAD